MNLKIVPQRVINEINKISRVAGYLWERQWAERNGGNISMNLTGFFSDTKIPKTSDFIKHKFPIEASGLYVFVTGAGCYIRSLIDDIEAASCIIYINKEANGYYIVWGGNAEGFKPTSELASHLEIHIFNKKNNSKNLAVLHAHPIELIVLSHHPIFNDEEKLNHSIWKMCPEARVYVPRGINCTPYSITQSDELAKRLLLQLKVDAWDEIFKPFTPGSKILVCPPSNKVMNMFNQPEAEVWTANLVEQLKELKNPKEA